MATRTKNTADKEPEIPKPGDAEIEARIKGLKKRGMNALDGWRCCIGAKRQAAHVIFGYIDALEAVFDAKILEAYVRPIPPSMLKALQVAVGVEPKALDIGWHMTTGAVIRSTVSAPMTQQQLQLVAQHLRVAIDSILRTEIDCLHCVEKKMWQQKTKRKKVFTMEEKFIYRRAPGGAKP